MSPTADTDRYWLVASDRGVFAFHAPFYGSTGSLHLDMPTEAILPTVDGQGYRMVPSDEGIVAFANA